MKHFSLVIVLLGALLDSATGQTTRHIVRFRDKNNSAYSLASPSDFLSAKAIARRLQYHIPFDNTDLPVSPAYLDSVSHIPGVRVVNASKWLNQVLLEISDPQAIDAINDFSFVITQTPMAMAFAAGEDEKFEEEKNEEVMRPLPKKARPIHHNSVLDDQGIHDDTINYGNNYPQVHIHEGEYLHKLGYRGEGITIAVLDAGFASYKTNPAFDSLRQQNRVIAEYDFVKNETSVNEDHYHGANCLSIMAANRPGYIVGTAPRANYMLFRTEDVASETPLEEQYWIAAAEWADSAGADMISSSLGYTVFDNPSDTYLYEQRDGNTAMITIAADLAAKKGMIVMNSSGNSGAASDHTRFVMCPADGDSVVAVGAVNTSGQIAAFSCKGPNASGRLKPNMVSVGWNAVYANTLGNPATGNGTSYSNPNIAGLIACLWQAFSEFSNMEIIDAVQRSAHKYDNPDEAFGYGIPNFRTAYQILETRRQDKRNDLLKRSWLTAFPVPFKESLDVFFKAPSTANAQIRLLDISGRVVTSKGMQVQKDNYYKVTMKTTGVSAGVYLIQYLDGRNNSIIKTVAR